MARKKNDVEPRREMEPVERLGLRVSAMIGAPKAQLERRAVIHRLDADTDEAWDTIMALLSETDGIEMVFNDDDSVTLTWAKSIDDAQVGEQEGELEVIEEEAPF